MADGGLGELRRFAGSSWPRSSGPWSASATPWSWSCSGCWPTGTCSWTTTRACRLLIARSFAQVTSLGFAWSSSPPT